MPRKVSEDWANRLVGWHGWIISGDYAEAVICQKIDDAANAGAAGRFPV